jgi:hypothetical protein
VRRRPRLDGPVAHERVINIEPTLPRIVTVFAKNHEIVKTVPALLHQRRQNGFGSHAGFDHQLRPGLHRSGQRGEEVHYTRVIQIAEAVAETEGAIER